MRASTSIRERPGQRSGSSRRRARLSFLVPGALLLPGEREHHRADASAWPLVPQPVSPSPWHVGPRPLPALQDSRVHLVQDSRVHQVRDSPRPLGPAGCTSSPATWPRGDLPQFLMMLAKAAPDAGSRASGPNGTQAARRGPQAEGCCLSEAHVSLLPRHCRLLGAPALWKRDLPWGGGVRPCPAQSSPSRCSAGVGWNRVFLHVTVTLGKAALRNLWASEALRVSPLTLSSPLSGRRRSQGR